MRWLKRKWSGFRIEFAAMVESIRLAPIHDWPGGRWTQFKYGMSQIWKDLTGTKWSNR